MIDIKYPVRLILTVIVLTILSLSATVWLGFRVFSNLTTANTNALTMQGLSHEIVHYDEILTHSAKLAATTGNTEWIDLYRDTEIKLETSIRTALDNSDDEEVLEAGRQTYQANEMLIDLENQSLQHVLSGRADLAIEILDSEEYENHKVIYKTGVTAMLEKIHRATENKTDEQRSRLRTLGLLVLFASALLLAIWISIIRRMRRWSDVSTVQARRRADAEEQVRQLNQNLEEKISARTHELQESEKLLHRQAHYDELTNLPNRRSGIDSLKRHLPRIENGSTELHVLIVDLDDFKRINDSLGHAAGDNLLRQTARRITEIVPASAEVFRLVGDEFMVLVSVDPDENSSDRSTNVFARNLIDSFRQPFSLSNDRFELVVTTSIGVAIAPLHGRDVDTVIRNCDMAMHTAKNRGRSGYHVFDDTMEKQALDRVNIESKLQKAIEKNQLSLNYQPQIDLHTGSLIGMEALLRWELPEDGFVSPMQFIPIAEETGLIIEIGEWVLNTACQQIAQWKQQYGDRLVFAVNVSPIQLRQPGFFETVENALRRHNLDPTLLELELTESALLEDSEDIQITLKSLGALGVRLALDDFGTGYSALSYLKRYRFDNIKIDRSFVNGLEKTKSDAKLVQAIITMAHGMNMKIVGEGAETADQCEILKEYGCDYVQGYYYSKPLRSSDFLRFAEQWNDTAIARAS